MTVPSPADPTIPSPAMALTAAQLLDKIRERGGRPYRMADERAFVLTSDEKLAAWLLDIGGRPYQAKSTAENDYPSDIWIHTIPVTGPSVWESLG
jgi:hypothetical protein